MKLVLASNNKGKIKEFSSLIGDTAEILSLRDIGFTDEIIENGETFEENSIIKAKAVAEKGYITIADDSGLCVDLLSGAPGVYSARYAGGHGDDKANRDKLLKELEGSEPNERTGRFVAVISIVIPDEVDMVIPPKYRIDPYTAEKMGVKPEKCAAIKGSCEGIISPVERGENGFGYDCIFYYPEFDMTFAEIDEAKKNTVSHRAKAMAKAAEVIAALKENN